MATQAKYEFGMLGQMCDHDKYPVLPAIDADGYDMSSDNERLNKMNTKLYFAACQNREKGIQLMKLDHPKLYSFIKLHLSHDSLAAVMMSEHFNVDKDINDPLKLWLAVKATQRPGSDAVDKSNRRVDTMNALHSCKQLAEEPIHVFYERWKYAYDTYVEDGNAKMEDLDQANLFLSAVSNAVVRPLKAEVHNEVIRGGNAPKDLSLMYHYICRYVVPTQRTKSPYGAAFATLGEERYRSKSSSSDSFSRQGPQRRKISEQR
jgi:hypothetical protein